MGHRDNMRQRTGNVKEGMEKEENEVKNEGKASEHAEDSDDPSVRLKKKKTDDPDDQSPSFQKIAGIAEGAGDHVDPSVRFQQITEKAMSFGLSAKDLRSLQSVHDLKAPKAIRKKTLLTPYWDWEECCYYLIKALMILTCILLAMSISFIVEWPYTKRQNIERWFNLFDADIEKESCILNMNDKVISMTRPPVNCTMCQGVNNIPKVQKLSPEEFEEKYAYTGKPVIITDAMQNWTAPQTFDFNFFKNIYREDSPAIEKQEEKCQFFPYKSDFIRLSEVFQMSAERAKLQDGAKPWYVGWSNCDASVANTLRQHYTRPYFLPRVAESSKTDWIFMGSPGYGAHIHIDNVIHPSWQAQIAGRKTWTLEPPPECYHVCDSFLQVTVNPGEIIVLDTNAWYHGTKIEGDEMSITIGSEYD